MGVEFTEQERAFRDEVRSFLKEKLPRDVAETVARNRELTREQVLRWQSILNEKGWVAPTWPKEPGGPWSNGTSSRRNVRFPAHRAYRPSG